MNLPRIYKAIDEGLKLSLIDFGSNKILKSSYVDSRTISKQDIDNWYESGEDMSEDLYNQLCDNKCISIYRIKDNDKLNNIFLRIPFENINLNWLDVSELLNFRFNEFYHECSLDILYWDVSKIPEYAFFGCKFLTSIKIPNSITAIGFEAFYLCKPLTSIKIPNSVKSISAGAFARCESLSSILIPNSVTDIDTCAFFKCLLLTSIELPNSITLIRSNAFRYTGLKYIKYNGSISLWRNINKGEMIFGNIMEKEDCRTHINRIICNDGIINIEILPDGTIKNK